MTVGPHKKGKVMEQRFMKWLIKTGRTDEEATFPSVTTAIGQPEDHLDFWDIIGFGYGENGERKAKCYQVFHINNLAKKKRDLIQWYDIVKPGNDFECYLVPYDAQHSVFIIVEYDGVDFHSRTYHPLIEMEDEA